MPSELARVLREVDGVEAEAITQWHAIPPPVVTGQPPILQNTGVPSVEILGKLMNYDRTISPNENKACASCHMPYAGFSGPIPSVNLLMIAYPSSAPYRAAKRTAQRYTYSSYFPPLQYDATQGLFFGGNFWDSRATGYLPRTPDGEQSQFPPVDPDEMANPDTACIAYKLSLAPYESLFEQIWGAGSLSGITWPADVASVCATPEGAAVFGSNTQPLTLSPADRTLATNDYDHWAESLSAFEHSLSISPFTSKFDAYLAGKATLTSEEAAGYALFRGKGNCNSCHLDGRSTAPTPPPPDGTDPTGQDTGKAADVTPVFTCFGSANEGLPKNPRVAFYYETTPDSLGFTPESRRLHLHRFRTGNFSQKRFRFRSQPQFELDSICVQCRRPNASGHGARCGHGAASVQEHRSARAVLPEGVLPQRLHQEPETTRPLLQHARRVPIPRPVRGVSGRNGGKGELLARARGHGECRYDNRYARSDG